MLISLDSLSKGLLLSVNDIMSFPESVDSYLKRYIEIVLSCFSPISHLVLNLNSITKYLASCLAYYYHGDHIKAYDSFVDALNQTDICSMIAPLGSTTLFRARPDNDSTRHMKQVRGNKYFTKEEMLHIDFSHRYKVGTERYSYPGLPCSYMCSSPLLCCDELHCYDDDLNIATFKTVPNTNIKILDLAYFLYHTNDPEETVDFDETFLLRWPLIACCSFYYPKEDTKEFRFHPEYIIPQFLLQYLIRKSINSFNIESDNIEVGYVYGISYISTRRIHDLRSCFLDPSSCINYVFPAFPDSISFESGLSQSLLRAFELEEVYQKNSFT